MLLTFPGFKQVWMSLVYWLPELKVCGGDRAIKSAIVQGMTATVSALTDTIKAHLQ